MMFLDNNNKTIIPASLTEITHYSVLDFVKTNDVDFRFETFDAIEEFESFGLELFVDNKTIILPINWSLLCSDSEVLSSIPLYSFRGRVFETLVFNPITGSMFKFVDCAVGRTIPNMTWNTPAIQRKKYFAIPIENKENPLCIFANRSSKEDIVYIGDIL